MRTQKGQPGGDLKQVSAGALLIYILGILLFLLAWWAISTQMPESRLVSPWSVLQDLRENLFVAPRLRVFGLDAPGYWSTLVFTIRNVLVGVGIGGAVGIVLGLASARSQFFRAFLDPVVLIWGTVPAIIAAPFFLLWFGVVPFTQVLLVAFYSAMVLVVFAQRAASNLDPIYERWAMTFGASRWQRFRTVLIPGTLPEIMGGIRIALAGAWGLETFAELLGSRNGIGQAIKALANLSNVPGLLAATVLVCLAAVLVDALVVSLVAWVMRWKEGART